MDYFFFPTGSLLGDRTEVINLGYQVPDGIMVSQVVLSNIGIPPPQDTTRYQPVQWPWVQSLMESLRFGESTLINDCKGYEEFGDSAYWVPCDILCHSEAPAIQSMIHRSFADLISQADAEPDTWYSLHAYNEDSSHTLEYGKTFKEVCVTFKQAIFNYGYSHINIDIWKNVDGTSLPVDGIPKLCDLAFALFDSITAVAMFGPPADKNKQTNTIPSDEWQCEHGGVVDEIEFDSIESDYAYCRALSDCDGWNTSVVLNPQLVSKRYVGERQVELLPVLPQKPTRELGAFVFPASRFNRDTPDIEIVSDYDDPQDEVEPTQKFTPDAFVAYCNDGFFNATTQYIRFISCIV